jgi:hypothetical protein
LELIVRARLLDVEDDREAVMTTLPDCVAVKTVATIPSASEVSMAGVKYPAACGVTAKVTTRLGRGLLPSVTSASTTAVVPTVTDEGLAVTLETCRVPSVFVSLEDELQPAIRRPMRIMGRSAGRVKLKHFLSFMTTPVL